MTLKNQSWYFLLPSNEEILQDLRLFGGSLEALLETCASEDLRSRLTLQIMEQLSASKSHVEEFDAIRAASERGDAIRARDEIVRLSKAKSNSQLTALKMVQEFAKDHKGKVVDAMDRHLEGIPEA